MRKEDEWMVERAIQFGEFFNENGLETPRSCSEDMLVVFKKAFGIWTNLHDQDDSYDVVGYFNEWMNAYLTQEFVDQCFSAENPSKIEKFNYWVNIIFRTSSNSKDTNHKSYIISTNKELTKNDFVETFEIVNRLLSCDDGDRDDSFSFPVSYNEGVNIDTLLKGFAKYTEYGVIECKSGAKLPVSDAKYYEIELRR